MLDKFKRWGIYVLVIAIALLLGAGAGYTLRWSQSPTIEVQTNGQILERTNIVYKPIIVDADNPCADIIGRYNNLLADYRLFLAAIPEIYEVTPESIRFRLYTQKYSIGYKYTPKPAWSITPIIYARAAFNPMGLYYGGGVAVEYYNFCGILMLDQQPAVTIAAGYKFTIPAK